jgi:hypothetical protein
VGGPHTVKDPGERRNVNRPRERALLRIPGRQIDDCSTTRARNPRGA